MHHVNHCAVNVKIDTSYYSCTFEPYSVVHNNGHVMMDDVYLYHAFTLYLPYILCANGAMQAYLLANEIIDSLIAYN